MLEALGDLDEAAYRLRRGRRRRNGDAHDPIALRIQMAELSACGIDDVNAIARRKTDEVLRFVGVAAEVCAVGAHRIDVADPFVIGDEKDALADPHGPTEISLERDQPREARRIVGVYPEVAGRTAAVSFPARWIVVIATDHEAAVAMQRERAHVTELESARRAAFLGDAEALSLA